MNKKYIFGLLLVFTFILISFKGVPSIGSISQDNAVDWSPETPDIGDDLTITYDPSIGTIPASATSVTLIWSMYVDGNNNIILPSPEMWPDGTGNADKTAGRFIETPMIKDGDIWTITFKVNEMPSYFKIAFTDGTNTDKNDGNYWIINTEMKDNRILARNPSFGTPSFLVQGEALPLIVKGPSTATNWQVTLSRGTTTVTCTVTDESYDNGMWVLTAQNDSVIAAGLYDLTVSATVSAKTRTNVQPHSVSVISGYKEDFTFIHISDGQIYPDGSGAQSGRGNITETWKYLNTLDAEFIIHTGDYTEWSDEISIRKNKVWQIELLDTPVFHLPGNHDEFEGTGEVGSAKIWGGGIGSYEILVGPQKHAWTYGNVSFVFIFSDDRNVEPDDLTWAEEQMAKDEFQNSATRILMAHHPLDASYASETVVGDELNRMLNDLQTYKVTYYLHGHLHTYNEHLLNGVQHICAPQTYPYANGPGGYVKYTVEEGIITNWTLVDFPYEKPSTSSEEGSTTSSGKASDGFEWILPVVTIALVLLYRRRRKF
ncbi:MAG: metallophosphoesterase family protein [Candidatus Thorarchaeota archaeon]